jgi:hypothetical protein
MARTRIATPAWSAVPLIGIVLALANWSARPDRAWAWSVAIATFVVMVIVRHISQLAVRRSSGDTASARSLASVTGAVAWGALIMVVALALTLAQAYGVVNDPDSGRRITMAVIGASLAASGNALPRMLPPMSSMQDNAARVQAFQRLAGWTWVFGGLGFATAWLALPIDAVLPVSAGVVAAAMIVTIAQLLRLRAAVRSRPERPQVPGTS